MSTYNSEELKLLILNTTEPLIFKQLLSSDLLKWSLEDWNSKLKDEALEFRLGKFGYTTEPQWERKTDVIKSSFKYFLQCSEFGSECEENKWLYFDYKYLDNWFTNIEELQNSISWAPLGFPNITMNDCTMWIGSKGAHTPCHIDTYGFNLIFQIYGRKLWIVAPPEENLKPTRIPYEESSIYSKLNFFSPDTKDFKGVNNCRKIILNPGEVLCLPYKWWHYVENLETAISINVWIPTPQDDEERLKESIVQLFVKQMVGISNRETTNRILNPNMDQLVLNSDVKNILEITRKCKNICMEKSLKKRVRNDGDNTESVENHCETNESEILEKYNFIEKIPKMSQDEFNRFLEEQRKRFKNISVEKDTLSKESDVLELLNIFTDNDVVSLITNKLLSENT